MRLLTVAEAAPALGHSRQGLYRIIREGMFPVPNAVVKFGTQVRINLAIVEEAMRNGATSKSLASSDAEKK